VVSAASYEARKFGVRSAMPISRARKLCPRGIYLPVRMDRYVEVSRQVMRILRDFTPLVEPVSLDEAFLDVAGTERLFGSAGQAGRQIKERIRKELDLTASIGIASNKFLAKLASDFKKPDGFFIIRDSEKEAFLSPLPVTKLWGVGEAMEKALKSIGVSTVGQLRAVPLETLQERFGKWAEDIYDLARGLGSRTVQPDSEAKSIGAETTFEEDTNDKDFLERMLLELSEDVGWRLREAGLHARNITLKVRFSDFRTITRSSTLPGTTNATIEIYGSALDLLRTKVNLTQERIRLIGVTAASLSAGGPGQLLLFGEPKQKVKKVDAVVDAVRRKLGRDAVKRGRLME
jgi:DNA polymerase-4